MHLTFIVNVLPASTHMLLPHLKLKLKMLLFTFYQKKKATKNFRKT